MSSSSFVKQLLLKIPIKSIGIKDGLIGNEKSKKKPTMIYGI
jgi:hypothetical protein